MRAKALQLQLTRHNEHNKMPTTYKYSTIHETTPRVSLAHHHRPTTTHQLEAHRSDHHHHHFPLSHTRMTLGRRNYIRMT